MEREKRIVEVFSAGCAVCDEAVALVKRTASPSCEVVISDLHDPAIAMRAKALGVRSAPAVVVDGKLANCSEHGVDEAALRAAGIGQLNT